ncbi:MAG: hypothetical protein R3C49_18390 [Planctomycetaceae bacterium]
MTAPQSIVVLGSTGSIGTSCLDVIRHHPQRMRLVGATANRSFNRLAEQAREFRPSWILLSDSATAPSEPVPPLPQETVFHRGDEQLDQLIRSADVNTVVSAVVGAAGLKSTWSAVDSGKRVALANKESLIVAGSLMTARAAETGAELLPVDSEHSAIFQAMQAGRTSDLRRIILTASGGPFRGYTREQLKAVTPDMALRHPTSGNGAKDYH